MIIMRTRVDVSGISGIDIAAFMLNCTDYDYQGWWPGEHLAFHTLKRYPNNLGNVVFFDEYVGNRRFKFNAVVTEYIPGKKLTWQMIMILKLPGWLTLEFEDHDGGTKIMHTLAAGYRGTEKILDPFLRVFLSREFESDLTEHAQIEFRKLAELLAQNN